ncbi:protein kinase [Streptomyces sp. NPDC055962]|uniref:serine/threonine-protein kinase n=1 Tax=Streptomyces sp. NPDC055962 TaxID=3345667 RepID=UPI0035E3B703
MHGGTDDDSGLRGSGATPLTPGDPRRIGAFRLRGVLGSGGMGRVYLGSSGGRYVAVKRVLPALAEDQDFLRHFGHELDNLARLPAGVSARLLASDRTAQPPWFATEYIPGITLSEALRLHGGALPPESLWRLLRDAVAGLRSVHAAEMVHRDLKPSNVMLTADGVTLIDFGVARAVDQSRLTRTGMVIGTPAYMAPEQAVSSKQLTGAADVFALGSLLSYAANGRPPFGDGSGPDLLYRIVHEQPDIGELAATVPALADAVSSCLAKDPADRPTVQELFDLAGDHTLPLTPLPRTPWPQAVAERIAERVAFAAEPPLDTDEDEDEDGAPATPPTPVAPLVAGPVAGPVAGTEPDGPAVRKPRERRRRIMLFVLPVVVVTGTTLTVALSPYDIPAFGDGPDTSAASPSTAPSATAGATPSPSAKSPSSRPPEASPAGKKSPSADAPDGGSAGGDTAADGTGTAGGKPEDAGSPGGSSGSSGTGGGEEPALPAPSTSGRLKNASIGRCVAESENVYSGSSSVLNAVCGQAATNGTKRHFAWTYKPVSATAFHLVNDDTGACLKSNTFYGLAVVACGGGDDQIWRIGARASGGHTLMNAADSLCLSMTSGTGFTKATCDAGDRTQLWQNA